MVLEIIYPTIKNKSKSETEIINFPTGYPELDAVIGGFYQSDLIIITGDFDSGKTALISQLAHNISSYQRDNNLNKTEIYLNLQHNPNKLNIKLISANCDVSPTELNQVNNPKIRNKNTNENISSLAEYKNQTSHTDNIVKEFFSLYENSEIQNLYAEINNFDDILTYIKEEAGSKDISALFIDGLDFINSEPLSPDNQNAVWQLAKLKNLATAFDISVIVTCNIKLLNLENDIEETKADLVFQIIKETSQRPSYMNNLMQEETDKNAYWKHSLKILKNNLGKTATLTLEIKKSSGKTNISIPYPQPSPFDK